MSDFVGNTINVGDMVVWGVRGGLRKGIVIDVLPVGTLKPLPVPHYVKEAPRCTEECVVVRGSTYGPGGFMASKSVAVVTGRKP